MTRSGQLARIVLVGVFIVGFVGASAAVAGEEKTLLRLRVDGPFSEAPSDAAGLAALMANEQIQTLHGWVSAVRTAAHDPGIDGLALIIEAPQVSFAQIEEMTRAINEFKKQRKPVYAYLDFAGNGGYALAAAADHVTLAEHSELFILGLHAEVMYFKGLLDKIGLEMDGMSRGAYKSALESFMRSEPSPEAAENINWLLDGLYERWLELIAEGRDMSVDEVRNLVDQAPLSADEALEEGLIDESSSFPAFAQRLRDKFGDDVDVRKDYRMKTTEEIDWENPFAMFQVFGDLFSEVTEPEEPGVGLVFIEGPIMVGKSDSSPFGGSTAGSTTIRAALEKARTDEKIKAVVVRVDSPGGSAIASDIIWKAATACAQEKPLVVSMGRVAGSGGYYVAIPGQTIFAENSTITGSIGVVSGKLIWHELMNDKLGISTTTFARGKNSGMFATDRPWNDRERAEMNAFMDRVYTQFKGRVMASRGERINGELEDMAGGRVYTGKQALELGLVDELGGIAEALVLAKKRAGLPSDADVYMIPPPSEIAEVLAMLDQMLGKDGEDDFEVRVAQRLGGVDTLKAVLPMLYEFAPQQVSEIVRMFQHLSMLNQERVGCFMPTVPIIN